MKSEQLEQSEKSAPWKQYSDVELVIAALVGNLQAFDELAIRYRPAILIVAEQIVGTAEAAEDVAQDALLIAFKALPKIRDVNRFGFWLYAITKHRALRYLREVDRFELRSELRSELDQLILKQSRAIAPDPAQIFERHSDHFELQEALKRLAPEYQVVLRLYYWEDMPQRRIADFLGLSLTTVKWRLYKAKQMLREHLEKIRERR